MTIDDMQAGPEMDRLVAEKVMGVPRQSLDWGSKDPWSPSTNIAHAWEVMDRMDVLGWELDGIRHMPRLEGGRWVCAFHAYDYSLLPQNAGGRDVAPTAPLAICRAALRAVGA